MMSAAVVSSLRVLRTRPAGFASVSLGLALDLRHDGDAGLEPGHAQRELGEDQQRDADHHARASVGGGQRRPPVAE